MATIFHVLSAVVLVAAAWMAFAVLRMRRQILRTRKDLEWYHDQASRAATLLDSGDPAQVLTGLQMLSALNVRDVRLEALRKVSVLAHSDDVTIAEYAREALDQMLPSASPPPQLPPAPSVRISSGRKSSS